MMTENVQALVTYRLEQADESIEAARTLLDKKLIRPSLNRAYYAMFYAVLALLAQEKKETSKHSGAIALFDRDYVKQGVFKKNYSRWLHDAFDLRQRSDYAAEYQATTEDAEISLANAEMFVLEVKKVLSKEF